MGTISRRRRELYTLEDDIGWRKTPAPLVVLLAVVIVLNLFVISTVRHISRAVETIPKQHQQELGLVRERVESISRAIDAAEREAAWYSHPRFELEVGEGTRSDAVRLSWSFRELARDSEVSVHFRIIGSSEWEEAELTRKAPLSFEARLSLPEPVDPLVEIEYRRPQADDSGVATTQVRSIREGDMRLEYVISAAQDKWHRSGGSETIDLGHWGGLLMGSVVEVDRNRRFNVTLVERKGPMDGNLSELSSVHFLLFGEGRELAREALEFPENGDMWEGIVQWSEEQIVDEIGFAIVTADGRETVETIPFD